MSGLIKQIHPSNDDSLKRDTVAKLIEAKNRSGQVSRSMRPTISNRGVDNIKSNFTEKYKLLLADPAASSRDINNLITKIKDNITQLDDEISKLSCIKSQNLKMLESLSRCIADDSITFVSAKNREFADYYTIVRRSIDGNDEADNVEIKLKSVPESQIKINSDGTHNILLESIRQKIIRETLKISFDPNIKTADSVQCFPCTVIGAIRR
jgi:hypothetical protein